MSTMTDLSFCVSPPIIKTRFLIFDVETTGLLPKGKKLNPVPIHEYPHILQLSYAIYDLAQKKIIKQYDSYINIDDSVEISEKIYELTGITRELCNNGKPIIEVLEKFYEAYMFCQGIVAHNLDFDEKMIHVELERNRPAILKSAPHCFMTFNEMYEKVHGIDRYCTMKKGTDLCNILVESKNPKYAPSKKWPRLSELYTKLFDGATVDGLHNSMIDVLACLRCYLKMRHNYNDTTILS